MLKSQFWCFREAEAPLTRALVGCNNHWGTSAALAALNQRHMPTAIVKLSAPRMANSSSYQDINYAPKAARSSPAAPCSQASTGSRAQHGSTLSIQFFEFQFNIILIFSNNFTEGEGKSSLVIWKRFMGQSLHVWQELPHAILIWMPQGYCTYIGRPYTTPKCSI